MSKASERHAEGMSCRTTSAYVYDANGHRMWCVDCGAELGEAAWHPDGAEVPRWVIVSWVFAGLLVIVLLAWLTSLPAPERNHGGRPPVDTAPAVSSSPEGR